MAKRTLKALRLSLLPLLVGSLFSCTSEDPGASYENPLGLEKGDGSYDLKGNVENKDGSLHYEIFVRSFSDSNGDGIGDFLGIASKADYLKSLGVSSVWLTPFNTTGSYHGYDVKDYYALNPEYGTFEDFKTMLQTLKEKGIKVYMDLVLNHSSNQNPWFQESYEDYRLARTSEDSKADWYMWSDESKGNDYYQKGQFYYLGGFGSSMPDFNWDSKGFRKEISKILAFWIEKGVAGFRLDAVRYYYEMDAAKNVEALNYLVEEAHKVDPSIKFVGENWTTGDDYLAYYDSKIDSFFCFQTSISQANGTTLISAAKGMSSGDDFVRTASSLQAEVRKRNPLGNNSFFLANHDTDRASKSLYGDYAKLGASLTYLLPGTPYVYYGEEIELQGVRGNESTDALRRLPMVWGKGHEEEECNFPDPSNSYLESSVEQVEKGAYDLETENFSLLNHYKKLGEVRSSIPFIENADMTAIKTGTDHFFAYKLSQGEKQVLVATNGSMESAELSLPSEYASWKIVNEVRTANRVARLKDGKLGLGAYSSAILAPEN